MGHVLCLLCIAACKPDSLLYRRSSSPSLMMRMDRLVRACNCPFTIIYIHLQESIHKLIMLVSSSWSALWISVTHLAMPFQQRLKAKSSANNGGGCYSATSGGASSAFPANSQPNSTRGVLLSMVCWGSTWLDNLNRYIWICCKLWYLSWTIKRL